MNQHYSNAFRYYCDLVNLTLHIFVIFYFIRELLILYWCEFYIFNFYRTFSVQIWIVKISLKRSYSAFSLDSNCHGTDAYSIRSTHLNESIKYSFMKNIFSCAVQYVYFMDLQHPNSFSFHAIYVIKTRITRI